MLPNTVFFSMSKLFTWEIIAQRQILQARHLRKNVSKIQIPSLQEISKQEIQRFMKFTVLWVRVLTYAPSLFAVKTNLSSLILLKIFHVQHSTASWLNLFLASILWLYETIQLNIKSVIASGWWISKILAWVATSSIIIYERYEEVACGSRLVVWWQAVSECH